MNIIPPISNDDNKKIYEATMEILEAAYNLQDSKEIIRNSILSFEKLRSEQL